MKDFGLSNDLQEILTQALDEMKAKDGDKFDLQKVNLSELVRRTGIPIRIEKCYCGFFSKTRNRNIIYSI